MRLFVGIDLAAKGNHEAFVLRHDGEVVLSRYQFATQADEIDRLRAKIMALCPGLEIWWISEPTGTQWVTVGQYLLGIGDRYVLVSNQKAHDLRRFWARQTTRLMQRPWHALASWRRRPCSQSSWMPGCIA